MQILRVIAIGVFVSFLWAGGKMTPVGKWVNIDDETGEKKAIIQIWEENGKLYGKIVKLLKKSEPNPKCTKCGVYEIEGKKVNYKNKPVEGMLIMWGLEKDSETEWEDGYILDPKKGKVYGCEIEVLPGGNKLKVRGYIGFSLLGRNQIWLRVE